LKIITVAFLYVLSLNVVGQGIVSQHCIGSCPDGAESNQIIKREIYTLSNNAETKFADWVCYKVTPQTIGKSKKRRWKADPALQEPQTLEPGDYKAAHKTIKTDRGHQAPLASFAGTPYWKQTNYLSNITPQKSALNQGAWVRLESKVRKLAKKYGEVWVMTGPLYTKEMPKLPGADEPHTVPSGYWKIVIVKTSSKETPYQHASFIFPQTAGRKDNICEYKRKITDIESKSKLRFIKLKSEPTLLCE